MNPGETTLPLTFNVSTPRISLPKRSLPIASIPMSIVFQRPSKKQRPPRSTNGNTGFSTEPSIRLHAGRARPAARGIDSWRNVLRFMLGESEGMGTCGPASTRRYRLTVLTRYPHVLVRCEIHCGWGWSEHLVHLRSQAFEFLP